MKLAEQLLLQSRARRKWREKDSKQWESSTTETLTESWNPFTKKNLCNGLKLNMKISIIVPVYNAEEYLSKCLESLVNQTYRNIEIILVDDGSTDASPQMCDEYAQKDDRIIVIHKENEGLSLTRNVGMAAITGDFFTFVDSDDWLSYNYVENLVVALEANDIDIVFTSYGPRIKSVQVK